MQISQRDSNFAQELWGLHNIMKRIPVFLRYFKMTLFTPMLMLTQTVLFYLKRPKPGNNSGANYPRESNFAQNSRSTQYYEPEFRSFCVISILCPIDPMSMLTQTELFYVKSKPGNNLQSSLRTQILHKNSGLVVYTIFPKRIPVFLR